MTPAKTALHTEKAPARSAKTGARAQFERNSFMLEPTRPLPQVDESLVASWPAGPERAMARNAYRLMASASAALEELLHTTDTDFIPNTPREFHNLPQHRKITHAAHALTTLNRQDAPTALWNMEVHPGRVCLSGNVHHSIPTPDVDQRAAMARWAKILGGAEIEESISSTGAVHLTIENGQFLAIPVRFYTILNDPIGSAL